MIPLLLFPYVLILSFAWKIYWLWCIILKAIQCNIIIVESLTSNINVTKKMTEWPMGYTLVHREQMSKQGYHTPLR